MTGSVLVWAFAKTGIVTWTVGGSTRTGVRALPRLSTAISGTSRSTDRPCGSIVTSAWAATTYFTTESGPDTETVSWLSSGFPTSMSAGVGPVLTMTGTV